MKQEIIFHNLIDFNGLMFDKKQWETILKGCGAPKSSKFWSALRKNVMIKVQNNIYRLHITSMCEIDQAWNEYCINNRASVKEAYYKKKAQSEVGQVCIFNNCVFK